MRARRPAPRFARQASARAAREHPRRRRAARAVYLGHLDRHRRNARGADRFAARPARAPRRLRPYPGNHHPEFPAESRNPHGRVAGALARGALVDHRDRAPPICAVDEHPGSAQPQPGRSAALDRGGHQRLGRGVAGHARSRQPGGAVAGAGRARARHGGGRQAIGRTAGDLSGLRAPRRSLGRSGVAPFAHGPRRRRRLAAHG